MIRYWCALPFNLNSNVIMQTSYRIYEKLRSQICIFNNPLQFVEIKAVLEGRGFRPKIFGKRRELRRQRLGDRESFALADGQRQTSGYS